MYNGNANITICDHPLIKHKLTMIRQKTTGTNEFRTIVAELAMLIGYEALRDLELEDISIETPYETAMCPVICGKKPVIVPILRAGLGMSEGLLKLIPAAKVGHIGVSRDKQTLEAKAYFCKMPGDLDKRRILVMDPMLATGGSAAEAIRFIKERGGRDITFLCIVAAPEGLDHLQKTHPDVKIFAGNLDREINASGYVCPGIGNAGDRIFGTE